MTDQPIIVHATPTQPQIEAALRQFIVGAGPVLTVLAATGWGEKLHLANWATTAVGSVGAISTVVAFVWGQVATRANAKKSAAMATMLPNSQAQTK